MREAMTVWTQSSTPDSGYTAPRDGRLVQIRSDGVLRVLDVSTGRVTSERSGLPGVTHLNLILLDDWFYLADSDGVRRIPITGTQPASQLTGDYAVRVLHCGPHVCVYGTDFVAAFDPATGKELWRKEIKPHNPVQIVDVQVVDAGIIMTVAGTGPEDEFGNRPDDHQVIVDHEGRDITPTALGTRRASWLDNENLLFEREIDHLRRSGQEELLFHTVELSVYSMATHEERPLGRHDLLYNLPYDDCTGLPGKYVCAAKDGFVLLH
jgi:hypothetical protein